eukprot:CAMPEP_0194169546 /NCGR_PEP_ID=MMETSP0154-20130528/4215_1 /TAXON_ID=1049557 /ORGANISM="Thalassiothrix antarctica, Strain L6-D1" /LENGTH=96 /DNA_ID=CAMNT_0038880991 /DNA_START=33 /DNA_END=320 /DNA_ORIENTATION=+
MMHTKENLDQEHEDGFNRKEGNESPCEEKLDLSLIDSQNRDSEETNGPTKTNIDSNDGNVSTKKEGYENLYGEKVVTPIKDPPRNQCVENVGMDGA